MKTAKQKWAERLIDARAKRAWGPTGSVNSFIEQQCIDNLCADQPAVMIRWGNPNSFAAAVVQAINDPSIENDDRLAERASYALSLMPPAQKFFRSGLPGAGIVALNVKGVKAIADMAQRLNGMFSPQSIAA